MLQRNPFLEWKCPATDANDASRECKRRIARGASPSHQRARAQVAKQRLKGLFVVLERFDQIERSRVGHRRLARLGGVPPRVPAVVMVDDSVAVFARCDNTHAIGVIELNGLCAVELERFFLRGRVGVFG